MVLGIYFRLPHAPKPQSIFRLLRPRNGNATIKTLNKVGIGQWHNAWKNGEYGRRCSETRISGWPPSESGSPPSLTSPRWCLAHPARCTRRSPGPPPRARAPTRPATYGIPTRTRTRLLRRATWAPTSHARERCLPTPTSASCTRRGTLSPWIHGRDYARCRASRPGAQSLRA